jgi:hypothetical protein
LLLRRAEWLQTNFIPNLGTDSFTIQLFIAKIDEIKELIGFLKVLFATFVAIDVSLIAWLTKNYLSNSTLFNSGAFMLIVLFSIAIVIDVKAILKNIKRLKDL